MGFEWGSFSKAGVRSIRRSNARLNIWEGAVRSSKTVCSIVRWLRYLEEAPPGPLLMAGKTERTLKNNILDPIEQMVGPGLYHHDRWAGEVRIAGRRILCRGANDALAESKIRGLTLSGIYGDEITLWPESFFKRCLDRLSVPGAKFFGTTNPDGPHHWLKKDYLDREHELDLKAFHFTLRDNPNLDPAYVAALEKEFTGLWYRRFVLGLWVVAEGAVFDQFDEGVHVVSELPAGAWERVIVGVDYGTGAPTAFIALGLRDGAWYAFAEHYYDARSAGRQKTDAEHSDDLRAFLARNRIVPASIEIDPSAASFKAQLRRDLPGRRARDADNAVLDGIRVVSRALTGQNLFVHRSCRHLIEEFGTYTWDPRAQEKGLDAPLKENDHVLDALRYAAMRALGRPQLRVLKKPVGPHAF